MQEGAGAGVLGTSMCAHRAFLPSHTDAARARGLSHINTLGAVFIGESSAIFLECIKHRNNSDIDCMIASEIVMKMLVLVYGIAE